MKEFLHMGLNCNDISLIESFYCNFFGFRRERVLKIDESEIVIISSGGFSLELFQSDGKEPLPCPINDGYTHQSWRHICFMVDNLDAVIAELGDQVRITLGPLDMGAVKPGMRICWVADPEGNIIELNQGYSDSE
ncbi:MAG: VOC family protein [Candidatus Wallbacteria bacterium]|nr:VOC family protein [Candidatus Wallbacteria bacterium]